MTSITEKKIDLSKAIEHSIFEKGKITPLSSETILEKISKRISKRISETKYDRIVIAEQYLEHFFKTKKEKKDITPIESFQTFKISNSLTKNSGNSCVALTMDMINLMPNNIFAYPIAGILSDIYQQYAGPKHSHVTPLISFQNPLDEKDSGYILLDPSFHISKPIVLKKDGNAFSYDMGFKKGLWCFSIKDQSIYCQPKERGNEEKWPEKRLKDSLMIYRTDAILNPVESSSNPMFIIDRSYPIVSRFDDGSQRAHINVNLDKKCIVWKIGKEKKPPISFNEIINGYKFDKNFADLLLLDRDQLNNSLYNVIDNADIFDNLYNDYINHLKLNKYYRDILKYPESILK